MANDTRSSRKVKDDENSNFKGVAGKPSTSSGAETPNTSGLRRSVRETPSTKKTGPSPSSTPKSERFEKRTPKPSVTRVEKQSTPSPLRRSDRGKKQSSSSSAGSKKSNKSSGLSAIKKKLKKEKSVKQLTLQTQEVRKIKKQVINDVQVGKKRLDARAYRALFKQKQKKVNVAVSDVGLESDYKDTPLKRKRNTVDMDSDDVAMTSSKDIFPLVADAVISSTVGNNLVETCVTCFRKQRVNRDSKQHDLCSCNSNLNQDISGASFADKGKKVANNDVDPISLKPSIFERDKAVGVNEGSLGAPSHNMCQSMSGSIVRTPSCNMHQSMSGSIGHLDTIRANHASSNPSLANKLSEVSAISMAMLNERINLLDSQQSSQKDLHLLLKPEIAKLCEILLLPEDVKAMAQSFLEYVMNNHHVSREPETILQAFQISLCWTAASLLKHKLDHKGSLALAQHHLNFYCKKEEADSVYSILRCLKKMFLYHTGNFNLDCAAKISESLINLPNKDCSHARSSHPAPSSAKKVKVGFEDLGHGQEFLDDRVLSHLGLARQDFSKSIKDVKKKCDKQLRKLLLKQKKEKEEHERKYKEEKAQLENNKKTDAAVVRLHSNSSMRTDKLKLLDIEYEKKFEEFERRMEICHKNLEAIHLVARNELEEGKVCWVDGVKSWAKMELINKLPSNETGHNQENAVFLNSHLKEKNVEGNQSMQDGVVLLEVPETVSSNDEDIVPGELYSNEQIPDHVKSDMLDGETPLRTSRVLSLRDGSENVDSVNAPSSEEQMQTFNGATLKVSARNLPIEVRENVNSSGSLENMGAPEIASSEAIDDGNIILREKDEVHDVTFDNAAGVDQQDGVVGIVNQDPYSNATAGDLKNGNVSLGLPESGSNKVVGDKTAKQKEGKVLVDNTIGNKNSDFSDKMAGVGQQNGEASSGVPDQQDGVVSVVNQDPCSNTTAGERKNGKVSSGLPESFSNKVVGDKTAKQKDGKVLVDNTIGNENSDFSDKMAGVGQQNVEASSVVPDQQDGVDYIVNQDPYSNTTAGNWKNGKVSSGLLESVSNKVVGDKTAKQKDGKVLVDNTIGNENSDFSNKMAGVGPSGGPETSQGEAVVDGETGKQQDGKVQANETVDNQDSQSLDRTAGVNQQDLELPSGVVENASGQVVEGASTGMGNDGAYCMASSSSTSVHLQDGVISSQVLENVPKEVVDGGSSGREVNGVPDVASFNDTRVVQQDRVIPIINEVNHPQELYLALQEESPIPTVSARLQDGIASGSGNNNSLQQVETSVPHTDDVLVSNQSNSNTSVVEHVQEVPLLPSTDSACSLDAMDFPSASGIEHQPGREDHITGNMADSSMQIVVDPVEYSNEVVSHPVTHLAHHLPSEIPLGRSGMHASDTRTVPISSGVNNRTAQTIPPFQVPPLPLYHDPLQIELERLRKETDQIINTHEDTKLRLKSDCEKEIEEVVAQIRRKYEIKLQETESEFILKKKELDTYHNKVLMNKILAEAFKSKCMDAKPSSAASKQQEVASTFMQQLIQPSSQPTAQWSAIVTGLSSAFPPAGSPQIAASSSRGAAPSLQGVHHSSELFLGALSRPPLISSISPGTGNLQIGGEIRAPAPHLQPCRPSASTVATNLSSLSVGMPSQQMPSNTLTTSAAPPQLPLRSQLSVNAHNFTHLPETAGTLPALSSSSLSAFEFLMNVHNQTDTNSCSPYGLILQRDLGSNSDLWLPNNTRTNVACPTEVVCLSDDD
ncbi:helicase protein MOM1 isoform X2 [Hevea brasiliensis]|uniref:helicase protein MOM1 isoform X2 n=1 Tax=Hevea brasiliensis TaxID=3981 RepID=UPI0025FF184F|nr:helicase protein MOM1 isoform X2 [Hevea brasiliensis]